MNWPRGFFRLWLVLTLLWVGAFVAMIIWDYAECLLDYREFRFCRGIIGLTKPKTWALILGWPIAALLAGLIVRWIARGFRR